MQPSFSDMNPSEFKPNCPGKLKKSPEGAWAYVPDPLPPRLEASWDLYGFSLPPTGP